MKSQLHQARLTCQAILTQVMDEKQSLAEIFVQQPLPPMHQSWIKNICFGVCRWYLQLDGVLTRLLKKPLAAKHQDVRWLLIIAIYQLMHTRAKPAVVVNETVEMAKVIYKPWAKGFINGVLRELIRRQSTIMDELPTSLAIQTSHPAWLVKHFTTAWPQQVTQILQANNQHPPLSLRVNLTQITREEYVALFDAEQQTVICHERLLSGVMLVPPMPVAQLPGFEQGWVYVQDLAAQWAAYELNAQAGDRVLDACAAPGGKTTHIAELQPQLAQLTAVDQSRERIEHIKENLTRLRLSATVICADVADTQSWWDGQPFDRILLDAPCSATGVIRRHPDIKWIRQPNDLKKLVAQQRRLLCHLWPLLKPGGHLLYVTCSILPIENSQQIEWFLTTQTDASLVTLSDLPNQTTGCQIFPGEQDMDGFYYAKLVKRLGMGAMDENNSG